MRRLISSESVWSRSVTSSAAEMPNELYVGIVDGGGGYGSANLLKVDEELVLRRVVAKEVVLLWLRRRRTLFCSVCLCI